MEEIDSKQYSRSDSIGHHDIVQLLEYMSVSLLGSLVFCCRMLFVAPGYKLQKKFIAAVITD